MPAPTDPPRGNWLKLLLLPAALVLAAVVLAMSLGRLGGRPDDAESLVGALEREDAARWRAAVNLASLLAGPDGEGLKTDPQLARRLAEVLRREVRAAGMDEQRIALRVYLCRALGEFRRVEVLPALAEAAASQRDPREADVRRSAVEALAVLAGGFGRSEVLACPGALPSVLAAADDPDPAIRSTAAFALGVFGGPEAERRLVGLLADARPEVRFNAATGLARHGDPRSEEVLLEMLQPNAPKDEAQSERPSGDDVPRRTVQLNALRAARVVLQAQRAGHPARLVEAVQRLAQAAADPSVRSLAREVMAEQSPRSDR